MGGGILVSPTLQELKELLRAPFLEQAHERTLDSLHLSTGNLGDSAIAIHKAPCYLLELKVSRNLCMNKDLGHLARCDDELGNQIHGIVAIPSKLLWDRLIRPELAVQLEWFELVSETSAHGVAERTCVRFRLALSPP